MPEVITCVAREVPPLLTSASLVGVVQRAVHRFGHSAHAVFLSNGLLDVFVGRRARTSCQQARGRDQGQDRNRFRCLVVCLGHLHPFFHAVKRACHSSAER